MTRSYLLYRCGGEGRKTPVALFTADSEEEAREAPTWLKRRHPDNALLLLGPGEFFEIIEKDMCPPDDWEQARANLEPKRAAP